MQHEGAYQGPRSSREGQRGNRLLIRRSSTQSTYPLQTRPDRGDLVPGWRLGSAADPDSARTYPSLFSVRRREVLASEVSGGVAPNSDSPGGAWRRLPGPSVGLLLQCPQPPPVAANGTPRPLVRLVQPGQVCPYGHGPDSPSWLDPPACVRFHRPGHLPDRSYVAWREPEVFGCRARHVAL